MKMKLYSGPLSLFTAKARIAFAEKSIDYERIEVGFTKKNAYAPKHPDVLRLNPRAQVPVFVHGDLVLYDSTLIVEYLEEAVPEPALLPRETVARARARMLEQHADEIFFPKVLVLIREGFYKPEAERDPSVIAEARSAIEKEYAELDGRLAGRTWLEGEFGAVDIAWILCVFFAATLGAPPSPELAHLTDWLRRGSTRPAVAKDLQEMARFSAALTE